ncbi:MAG: M28 family peptidase [Caldilineaceae bacterium]|nr:M28 family peptidase [Caldilineaceae bacterium]
MRWFRSLGAYTTELSLIAALLAAIAFFVYLGYGLINPDTANPNFSGQQAMMHVTQQMGYGPRFTGSPGNEAAGDWLIEELGQAGWSVYIQPFRVTEEEIPARNIIAVRGEGPTAMITTHYDSRLFADKDGTDERRAQPAPGANDAASGAAVLLELARTLVVNEAGREVCLVFFDASSNGGIPGWEADMGIRYFVDQLDALPRCGAPRTVVMVRGVGDMDQQILRPINGDAALIDELWQVASTLGYEQWRDETAEAADNADSFQIDYFAALGIPTVEISDATYRHSATLADTADKLSGDSLQRVGRVLEVWLEEGQGSGD